MWSLVSPRSGARSACRLIAFVTAIGGFASDASAQTTVTLSTPGSHISVDTTIRDGAYGANNYSTSDSLVSKKTGGAGLNRRILVKVDTENYIPANAVIQSARLYLVLKIADTSEQRPLTAYRVTQSFTKTGTSWHYFGDGDAWTTPGGDVQGSFGTTTVGSGAGTTYTFELTDLVQRSVNGEFGSRWTRVELIDTGGNSEGSYKAFHSTRAASASVRPRLVVTYTSGASVPPSPPPAGTTLRVMQWNIKNARGSDGVCNPDRIASTIVAQQAQVVSLNEVKSFAGECAWTFDMSAKLESLLEVKSGVPWYRKYVEISGKAGNVLLSRLPLVSSSTTLLSYSRGVAQVGVVVNGRTINLFSTHVEYYTAAWRTTQINQALAWMRNFPEPRIMLGDFNTTPGTSDYALMASPFQDAWMAAGVTRTAFNGTGGTHGGSRFDYVFYSRVAALSLQSVKVPDTRISGVYPSDHYPVVAVFTVR
jgi:endonuclease/exonuclease/phosphatase family metal-dependent hydrolase